MPLTRELVDIIFLKKLANALEIKYALIKFSRLTFGAREQNKDLLQHSVNYLEIINCSKENTQ